MTIEPSKLDDRSRKYNETLFSRPRHESPFEPRAGHQIAVKGRSATCIVHACPDSRSCRLETRPFTARSAKKREFFLATKAHQNHPHRPSPSRVGTCACSCRSGEPAQSAPGHLCPCANSKKQAQQQATGATISSILVPMTSSKAAVSARRCVRERKRKAWRQRGQRARAHETPA